MIAIPMKVSVSNVSIPMGVTTDASLPVSVGTTYQAAQYPTYTGEYVFTPTRETQIVDTEERVLVDDIIINPIPSNYGLVTYNGAIITVS